MTHRDEKSSHPAFREYDLLGHLLQDCHAEGRISLEEMQAVFAASNQVFAHAGIEKIELYEASIAALRHANHAMRRKLLELHPELAEEVSRLNGGRQL